MEERRKERTRKHTYYKIGEKTKYQIREKMMEMWKEKQYMKGRQLEKVEKERKVKSGKETAGRRKED